MLLKRKIKSGGKRLYNCHTIYNPTMQNNISSQPNPVVTSYLKHFQIALMNLNLFLQEEKPIKRRRKFNRQLNKSS